MGIPYGEQLERKRQALAALAAGVPIEMISPGQSRLRDRVDLTWNRKAGRLSLGLYHLDRSRVVDITRCPQLTPPLEEWLTDFYNDPPPVIEKGSVRLRVSPDGARGAWLDLANADVKALFEERQWLTRLQARARVEIGQRHKPLVVDGERLRLGREAVPRKWFETYVGPAHEARALFSVIGSFTQPGFRANRELIAAVQSCLAAFEPTRVLELFSGLGNFTLPLAAMGHSVSSYEVDELATRCFESTLAENPELASRIRSARGNLYAAAGLPLFAGHEILFVDPPRSGLRNVLDALEATPVAERPRRILYVSCFAESLASDLERLVRLDYAVSRVCGVDQFAQSPHCEWVVLLEIGRTRSIPEKL